MIAIYFDIEIYISISSNKVRNAMLNSFVYATLLHHIIMHVIISVLFHSGDPFRSTE